MKYHAYIGRWQSPHMGHRWLIDRNLAEGKPVLIMIRDVPTDENNPFTASEVYDMLDIAFRQEVTNGLVSLQIIPDIASVNYGRGVGYDVICHEAAAPAHVKRVSATEIRRQIRAGEEGWREMVMPGVAETLEAKFNG
jgi:nicotinamide mononucleotide adenylyltransferase